MEQINLTNRRYYALMVIGISLPFLLYPFLSTIFISSQQDIFYRLVYSRFLIWSILGLLFLYARQGEVQKLLLWHNESYKSSFYLKGIAALYLLTLAAGFISNIPDRLGWHDDNAMTHKMQAVMQQHPVLLVFGAVTAGITEELIFRGYTISRLSLLIKNKHLPILISAFLFAMIHLGYKSIKELIFAFLMGIIYGYHYQKYKNIYILIITHVLVDIIAFSIYHTHHKG